MKGVALWASIAPILVGVWYVTREVRDGFDRPSERSSAGQDGAPASAESASTRTAPSRSAANGEAMLDEASLMNRLRGSASSNPALALELAREGNRRFPDTHDAAERASILIHALANMGRASEARGEAEEMVNLYPDSAWVREIERFTGAHRHRNVRVTRDGKLEYYK